MKKYQKIGIPLLMIISMVLITGFVSYWLKHQYQQERENLVSKMTYELRSSEEQVMDEVLIGYLAPMLGDSVNLQSKRLIHIDTTNTKNRSTATIRVDYHGVDSMVTDQGFFALQTKTSESNEDTVFSVGLPRQQFLLRGVKMILDISSDSLMFGGKEESEFFPTVDSQKLLYVFDQRVQSSTGKDFMVTWVEDSSNHELVQSGRSKRNVYLSADHLDSNVFIEVEHVEPYVLGRILPQISFALILLLLSGSAFFISYRSLRQQMELNSTRNEFISNISHELKTPVSTVKVALEALKNYDRIKDPVITREYLDMATSELDRLDMLTHKVLTHSKLESKASFLDFEEIELVSLCSVAIKKWQAKIDQENGTLKFIYSDNEILINADGLYLEGVILNLIDNGLKYAGPKPDLELELTSDQDEVRISISDRGPGIPAKYHKQIFDKFFRLPTQNKHNVKGHGLGLSFAAQVIHQHGGKIRVKERPGGGCVFEIILPK